MSLITELDFRQVWGGHTPILQALVKYLRPALSVECGSGNFSTPILLNGSTKLVTIEHDTAWAQKVADGLGRGTNHSWIVESVPGIDNSTSRLVVSEDIRQDLDVRYSRYAEEIGQHALLFVDTFTAARVPAVNKLGPLAQVIVIHDTENAPADCYGLPECNELLVGRHRYSYQPQGHTVEFHQFTHTEIFSLKPLDTEWLQSLAAAESLRLWNQEAPLRDLGKHEKFK